MKAIFGILIVLLVWVAAVYAQEVAVIVHKHADSVGFYDPSTGKLLETITVGKIPHEIALSRDGKRAYVTNYGVRSYTQTEEGGNKISILDLAAARVIGEIDLGQFHRPHGIEMARSGRLYVTVDFPPTLLVIDPQQKKILRPARACRTWLRSRITSGKLTPPTPAQERSRSLP
jgi:DNA-binding beta-propeller fold protein YncE